MKNYTARVLLEDLSLGQNRLLETRILAPYVPPGGMLKTRLQGKLHSFQSQQSDFEGWGIFQPRTHVTAKLVDRAAQPLVDGYLGRFPCWEMRLIRFVRGRTWLAQARHNKSTGPRSNKDWFNPSDGPMLIHLVEDGYPFAVCRARFDGRNMWWEGLAPNADGRLGFAMVHALEGGVRPDDLRMAGLTLFDRIAYSARFLDRWAPVSGGSQAGLVVRWVDSRGELQSFILIERDLKVASAGISLSGGDQFDQASLSGVLDKLA